MYAVVMRRPGDALRFRVLQSRSFGHDVLSLQQFLFFEFRVVLERTGASLSGSKVRERVSNYWTRLGLGLLVFGSNFHLLVRCVLRHFGGLSLFLAKPGYVRRELVVSD